MFLELVESELNELYEESDETLLDFLEDAYDTSEYDLMKEEMGFSDEEHEAIVEALVKRVDSKGNVTRTQNRRVRKARATQTTGLSRSALKARGRKAARARRANPGAVRQGLRKRRRALKRRKQMNIK